MGVWLVLSDEQMSKRWPFSLLNDEQMSNWVGVKHLPGVEPKIERKPPKRMVKIMENPMNKWMIWGAHPYFWFNTHVTDPVIFWGVIGWGLYYGYY